MRIADQVADSSGYIISSIINLVCPQCGGRMSVFECQGRCRRIWRAEWQWANQSVGGSSHCPHARPAKS
jgi:hypothetical protein